MSPPATWTHAPPTRSPACCVKLPTNGAASVVMVTHDPRIAAYANRIVFLKDGKIVDEAILDGKNGKNAELVSGKIKQIGD